MTPAAMAQIHAAAFPDRRIWSGDELEKLVNDPSILTALTTNGFALGRVTLDELEILTAAIDPDHQGHGQGRQVVQTLLDHAICKGSHRAFLEVQSDNQQAIGLYLSLGFSDVGIRRGYYRDINGNRHDARVLGLDLSTVSDPTDGKHSES